MTESSCPFVFYQFRINPPTNFAEAEMSLQLALVAVEGIYGEARIRLEARYKVDEQSGTLTVDVRTGTGEALAQIFASLMIREFGNDSFSVARIAAELEPLPTLQPLAHQQPSRSKLDARAKAEVAS